MAVAVAVLAASWGYAGCCGRGVPDVDGIGVPEELALAPDVAGLETSLSFTLRLRPRVDGAPLAPAGAPPAPRPRPRGMIAGV